MIQAVTINSESVGYSLDTKSIVAVMGAAFIYKVPTFEEILKIVYMGLENQHGHTADSFVRAYKQGQIYTSKRRRQVSMHVVRFRVQGRIRTIPKNKTEN